MNYVNEFVDADGTDHIQRFKFNQSISKQWHIPEAIGLNNIHIYLDTIKKEYQKVKKPEETKWRNRTRKWFSGRFECDFDLYNCTFGFSQYDNEPYGEIWVNYDFLCSKKYDVGRLIKDTLVKDGWNFKEK